MSPFIYMNKNMLNLPKKRNIFMPQNIHINLAKPFFFFFIKKLNKQTLSPVLIEYFYRFQEMEIGV